jgi:vacuolar-type H+-ATPase subunit D/Vma8
MAPRTRPTFDAKTIIAITGLVSVLLGGAELRISVAKLDDKVSRIEDRVNRIEREVAPRHLAQNGDPDEP